MGAFRAGSTGSPETAASRGRVSQLSAAILRIGASLHRATVLQEAVASPGR